MSTAAWAGLFQGLGNGLQTYAAMRMAKEEKRERQERDKQEFDFRKAQVEAQREMTELQKQQVEFALQQARDNALLPKVPVRGTKDYESMLDREGEIEARHRARPAGSTPTASDINAVRRGAVNTDIDNLRAQLSSTPMRLPERPTDSYTGAPMKLEPGAERAFVADSTRVAGERSRVEQALNTRTREYGDLTDEIMGRSVKGDPRFSQMSGGSSTAPAPGAGGVASDQLLLELDRQYGGDTAKIKAELARRGFRW